MYQEGIGRRQRKSKHTPPISPSILIIMAPSYHHRASLRIDKVGLKSTFEKRMEEKRHRQMVKSLEAEMKKEREDARELAKAQRKEKLARKEENQRRGEVYQVVSQITDRWVNQKISYGLNCL
jgi:polyribonucleotide nucleotidyltransferase